MAYTKAEFRGPRFSAKALSARWDRTVSGSAHFQHAPTVTDHYFRQSVRGALQRWVPDPRGRRVLKLDLYNEATGTALTGHLTDHHAEVVGIDISWKITAQAHARGGAGLRGVQGDVRELPFRAESFDVVFSIGTLEHVQDADRLPTVRELFRVLKPGGLCILGVNNRYSVWLTPLLFEFLEWSGWIRDQWSYEPTYPPSHLKGLLHRVGFTRLRHDGVLLFPKWLRAYDLWSASRGGRVFRAANALKDRCYRPLVWGIERLERWGTLNYFADQTLTIGVKPFP